MKNNGFTIIELFVVIVFLGIFAAIVIPVVQSMIQQRNSNDSSSHISIEIESNQDETREYIDNTRRDNVTTVEIKTHSDGTRYACIVGGNKCYRVR